MLPSAMPTQINNNPAPKQKTPSPRFPNEQICGLEVCGRKVKGEGYTHCSALCRQLDMLMYSTEDTCALLEPAQAGELWSSTVETIEQLTKLAQQRRELHWKNSKQKHR